MSLGKVTAGRAGVERPKALGSGSAVSAARGDVDSPVCLSRWSSLWTGRAEVVAKVEVEADPFLGPASDWSLRCSPPPVLLDRLTDLRTSAPVRWPGAASIVRREGCRAFRVAVGPRRGGGIVAF